MVVRRKKKDDLTADEIINRAGGEPTRRKEDKPKGEKNTEQVTVYFTKTELKDFKKYCFDNDLKMASVLKEKALEVIQQQYNR